MNSSRRADEASEPVVRKSCRNSLGSLPCAVSHEQISAVMILVVAYKIIAILNALGIHGSGRHMIVSATSLRNPTAGPSFAFSPPTTIEHHPGGITPAGA